MMINMLKHHRRRILQSLACLMMISLSILWFSVVAFADNEKDKDFTFYKVASAAATYYDQTHTDLEEAKKDHVFNVDDSTYLGNAGNLGRAGAFVGFIDEDYDSGIFGATVSYISSSAQDRSYNTYSDPAIKAYVQYGHALNAMGFDSVETQGMSINGMLRGVAGFFIYIFYLLAASVQLVFNLSVTFLQIINPFAWILSDKFKGDIPLIHLLDDTRVSSGQGSFLREFVWTTLTGFRDVVTSWYHAFQRIGLSVIPFFFVALIISIVFLRKQNQQNPGKSTGNLIRKYALRVIFIVAGIPLLGAMYTSALDSLVQGDNGESPMATVNNVIATTFVDFEFWSVSSHLALPQYGLKDEPIRIVMQGSSSLNYDLSLGETTDLKVIAYGINKLSKSGLIDSSPTDAFFAATSLINRYMSSASYNDANFETSYKSITVNSATPQTGYDWFNKIRGWLNSSSGDGIMESIKADGDAKNYETESRMMDVTAGGAYFRDNTSGALNASILGDRIKYTGQAERGQKGLSTLSMYNYLTTNFSDTTLTTYSSHKVASSFMRKEHRSVNLVGSGFTKYLHFSYACLQLLALSIIGYFYAFAMLGNMFKRGLNMIMSLPFSLMGNLKSIAKTVTIAAMMIIEIIGTMFVYNLMFIILVDLERIFTTAIKELGTNFGSATGGGITAAINVGGSTGILIAQVLLTVITIIVTDIVYIIFIINAIKYRKTIVRSMDELMANAIDKIFSPTYVNDPNRKPGPGVAYASRPTMPSKLGNAAKQVGGLATSMVAANAIDNVINNNSGDVSTMSKGDAALAVGVDGDIGDGDSSALMSGGQGGVEGSSRQGVPSSSDSSVSSSSDTFNSLISGGGTSMEQSGHALLANQSLGEHSQKGLFSDGKEDAHVHDSVMSEVMTGDAADAGEAVVRRESLKEDLQGEGKAKMKEGTLKAAVGAAKVAAGYTSGNVKLAIDGAQDIAGGVAKTSEGRKEAKAAEVKADKILSQERKDGSLSHRQADLPQSLSKAYQGTSGSDVSTTKMLKAEGTKAVKSYVGGGAGASAAVSGAGASAGAVQGANVASKGASSAAKGLKQISSAQTQSQVSSAQGSKTSSQVKASPRASSTRQGTKHQSGSRTQASPYRQVSQPKAPPKPETMSQPQLRKAVGVLGSQQSHRMGRNEAVASVRVAQSFAKKGGTQRSVQRSMSMAEGQTNSSTIRSQAGALRKDVLAMKNLIKVNPNASAYTYNNVSYTKAGLEKDIQHYQREADIREYALYFREARAVGRETDMRTTNYMKTISNKRPNGDFI